MPVVTAQTSASEGPDPRNAAGREPAGIGDKQAWRDRIRRARKAIPAPQRQLSREANTGHLLTALRDARSVAGYLPLPSEPLDDGLLDQLVARGVQVIVPITETDRPLDWARYPTATDSGPFGIRTPRGARLGQAAIGTVEVVLVPAFAVDRRGVRLGRGGGHYDRTLVLAPAARRIAVLYDGELVDELPAEPHDLAVHAVVTPSAGLVEL